MRKMFYLTGTLFFFTATVYFIGLLWKMYVWWNWLHRMEDAIMDQSRILL